MQASVQAQVVSLPTDFHRTTLLRSNRGSAAAPVLLAPTYIERMLMKRRSCQVVKFRTTCSDCVPNL